MINGPMHGATIVHLCLYGMPQLRKDVGKDEMSRQGGAVS